MIYKEDGTVHFSWGEIHRGSIDLVNETTFGKVPLKQLRLDAVVGVSRGGLVPAVIISDQLDIKLITVDYSARRKNVDGDVYTQVPPIDSKYHKVLIVDDIADHGHTLRDLRMVFVERGHQVFTGTIVHKPESEFIPDYIRYTLEPNSGWVVFSWEKEATVPNHP